jgi:hypothetical protein
MGGCRGKEVNMKVRFVVTLAGGFFARDDRYEQRKVTLPDGSTFKGIVLTDGTESRKGQLRVKVEYKLGDEVTSENVYLEKATMSKLVTFMFELI